MNQEKKPWPPARRREIELGRKGVAVLGSTSWLPLEKRHPTKQCVVVVKRRRDGYVGNGLDLSDIQNREDSGTGLKIAAYGRPCVPHGKSANLQRIPLCRPPPMKKNPMFLPLVTNC